MRRYGLVVAKHGKKNHILSNESLLYMLEWAVTEPNIVDAVTPSPETSLPLLQLVLLFNDKALKNFALGHQSYKTADQVDRLQAMVLGLSFPQSDLQNRNFPQLFQTQNHKLALMLEYMERTPKYEKLYAKMLEDFHCTDKLDLFQALGKAVVSGINKKGGWTILEVAPGPEYEKRIDFLNCLSIFPTQAIVKNETEEKEVTPNDFKELRKKPLLRLEEDKYQVLNEMFLTKFAYNGVAFHLSGIVKAEPNIYLSGDSFPGHWRQDFSEGELTYGVYQTIFNGQPAELLTGEMFKQKGLIDSEPDHFTRRGNTIFLTESKDVFIPADVKMSYSYDKITSTLSQNDKGKRDRFGKAVFQLAKNIGRMARHELPVNAYNVEDIEVFPILLVHDSLYSAPGLNYWVERLFRKEMSDLKKLPEFNNVVFPTAHPVTMIEIDTLLLFQDNFNNGSLDLENLLRKYHKYINQPAGAISSQAQAEAHITKTAEPFSDFVTKYVHQQLLEVDDNTFTQLLEKIGLK